MEACTEGICQAEREKFGQLSKLGAQQHHNAQPSLPCLLPTAGIASVQAGDQWGTSGRSITVLHTFQGAERISLQSTMEAGPEPKFPNLRHSAPSQGRAEL